MTADAAPNSTPRPRTAVVLLVAYAVMVAWVFFEQANSWPHEGSLLSVVLYFLCPGIVFQSFSLAYTLGTRRPLTRRVLARVVTIPLGLIIAVALSSWASTLAMRSFEQAYAPFVAKVGVNPADACRSAGDYFAIPAVVAYNRQVGRERPFAKLYHESKRFVLAFSGGSADIDGSTIAYDSGAGAWRKFHNNDTNAQEVHAGLTAGLVECPLRAQ